jgi:hypothetical protein
VCAIALIVLLQHQLRNEMTKFDTPPCVALPPLDLRGSIS